MVDFETLYLEPGLQGLGQPRFDPSANISRILPMTGDGILAGTFPDGITSIEGRPTPAEVRVLYRPESGHPGDGTVVAITHSAPDGTWLVEGLNPNLKFDVVGRKSGFNDVIMADIRPYSGSVIFLSGGFEVVKPDRNQLSGGVAVSGGVAPYSVSVIGTAPDGIQFAYVNGMVEASGTTLEWGDFSFTLRVTDANGVWAETSVELISVDGQWDKVVALLHFDGDAVNEQAGLTSTLAGAVAFSEGEAVFGQSAKFTASQSGYVMLDDPVNLHQGEFTIELWVRPDVFSAPNNTLMTNRDGGTIGWLLRLDQNQSALFGYIGTGQPTLQTQPGSLPLEEWSHVAVTLDSDRVCRIFIGGVLSAQSLFSGQGAMSTRNMSIGRTLYDSTSYRQYGGYLDELRITKGVARYTEDFTPPKGPF